jgi:hypothetical protein
MTTNNPAYDTPGGYNAVHRTPSIRLIGKTGEIIENAGDQLLPARILSLRCGSKKLDKISRFLCNRRPAGWRSGHSVALEFLLAGIGQPR